MIAFKPFFPLKVAVSATFVMLLLSPVLPTVARQHGASFDCSKANSAIEKAICGNAKLADTDSKLAAVFAKVRNRFDSKRRDSLIAGQRIWLKLRDQACPAESVGPNGMGACLQSVYEGRLQELDRETALQDEEAIAAQAPKADLDAVLDAKRDLAAYYPVDMSAMQRLVGDTPVEEKVPETCREFYTLVRGAWSYGTDNIGMSSQSVAETTCDFALTEAQKWPSHTSAVDNILFGDITRYSWEFGLLSGSSDYDGKEVRTFAQEQSAGRINIKLKQKDDASDDATDCLNDNTLVIRAGDDPQDYCFEGWRYIINKRSIGDFTHHGDREALIEITGLPAGDMGTSRVHTVLVAYFDSATGVIRRRKLH